ncbi:MAG: T9SS C-terminal target domain-containing protein [Bacteroidetes bacterium]|nr:MAG: T9SS C-terminal target domain-containing protein [Bacteroidota bacterium]MBL1143973.1 T9SS C-terminal target domain-containing protein [Bacteroidota bacterium]NOG56774.1 T9SS type A sorting domain-containing protein [Bacteroidota bacterium]
MAKFIFSVFLTLFVSTNLLAQSYTPFPTKDIIWKQDYTWEYSFTNTNICSTKTFEIEKDTLINSLNYHKLIKSTERYEGTPNYPCTLGVRTYKQEFFGSFRNDSIHKKVWLRLPNTTQDSLWFDFNYSVGDTLRPSYAIELNQQGSAPLIITRIDSILLGNKSRRTYIINDSSCLSPTNPLFGRTYPSQLIEGIGSSNGIGKHNYNCHPASQVYLACVQLSGQTIYPTTNQCNTVTNLNEVKLNDFTFSFNPNPSNGEVFITNKLNLLGTIKVYDAKGKLIVSSETIPQKIELPGFNKIYFIVIQTEKGRRFVEKIVVN